MIMTNNVVLMDNAPLSVNEQVLLAIKKRYDLNPQQKELVFELSGFGVVLNNKNDYLAIVTVLDGLKDKAGIEYVIEGTYTDSRGRTQHYTLYGSQLCKIKIANQKLFGKATQEINKKPNQEDNQIIKHNSLSYNLKSCELRYKDGKAITVSSNKREMKFFLFLDKHKGEVCPFKDIAQEVGTPEYLDNPELDNQDYTEEVSTLRRDLRTLLRSVKMPLAEFDKMIERVPKLGYKLV